ncbi:uncharacterized protein LOC135173782 [Pogoniulus pusillus]|uniref:uncharacterized protein LOC135173782 n=1 Tax=Pogoniulus pusillus TaxID=488313 RepID=UPI0030B96FE6
MEQPPPQAATAETEAESVTAEAAEAEGLQASVANDPFYKLTSVFETAHIRKVMDTLANDTMEQVTDKSVDMVIMLYKAFKDVDGADKESFLMLAGRVNVPAVIDDRLRELEERLEEKFLQAFHEKKRRTAPARRFLLRYERRSQSLPSAEAPPSRAKTPASGLHDLETLFTAPQPRQLSVRPAPVPLPPSAAAAAGFATGGSGPGSGGAAVFSAAARASAASAAGFADGAAAISSVFSADFASAGSIAARFDPAAARAADPGAHPGSAAQPAPQPASSEPAPSSQQPRPKPPLRSNRDSASAPPRPKSPPKGPASARSHRKEKGPAPAQHHPKLSPGNTSTSSDTETEEIHGSPKRASVNPAYKKETVLGKRGKRTTTTKTRPYSAQRKPGRRWHLPDGTLWSFGAYEVRNKRGKSAYARVSWLQTAPPLPKSHITCVAQYPLPAAAKQGITEVIADLEKRKIVTRTHSPYNSPVWPVRKPDGRWRLTINFRKLNSNTLPLTAAVPSLSSTVTAIQAASHTWMATLDMKDMFFMVPLREEDKPQFAFTWQGIQYTFNSLPQGYKHSATIAHNTLAALLDTVQLPKDVKVYHYIDDILVGGKDKEQVATVAENI